MKPIFHLIVYAVMFVAGAGSGIYYCNTHPGQGGAIGNAERRAVLTAEINVYKRIIQDRQNNPADSTGPAAEKTKAYQDDLDQAQKELDSLPPPTPTN